MLDPKYNDSLVQILEIINTAKQSEDSIPQILSLLKKTTEFEAVAIRIKDGFDYPYYVTEGFPDYFVKAENFLCSYSNTGELKRGSNGYPILECMCGNVIERRFDSSKDFFTEQGSFWSNWTSELLATTTDEDRQARTRNRCNGEGYESVALIPLSLRDKNIGLLQFNDTRKNMFTKELIHFFEKLGRTIGIAYTQKLVEDKLTNKSNNLDNRVKELNFLNAIAEIIEKRDVLDKTCKTIANSIKSLFSSRDSFSVKISVYNSEYFSRNFEEGQVVYIFPIQNNNNEIGELIIYNPNFMINNISNISDGQKSVINVAVQRLCKMIEFKMISNALKKSHDELEIKVKNRTFELEKASNELNILLSEKEMLLKEVHHRIKNNMQVMRSLLQMQSNSINDPDIESKFQDATGRIDSMLVLYDKLYRGDNYQRVSIKDYIHQLSFEVMNVFPDSDGFKIKLDIEDFIIHTKIIFPLGIITNELLTNTMKYAFPDKQSGTIIISVSKKDDHIIFFYEDNGIGINERKQTNKKGFGLTLIEMLTKQIEGTYQIENINGTKVRIEFDL